MCEWGGSLKSQHVGGKSVLSCIKIAEDILATGEKFAVFIKSG